MCVCAREYMYVCARVFFCVNCAAGSTCRFVSMCMFACVGIYVLRFQHLIIVVMFSAIPSFIVQLRIFFLTIFFGSIISNALASYFFATRIDMLELTRSISNRGNLRLGRLHERVLFLFYLIRSSNHLDCIRKIHRATGTSCFSIMSLLRYVVIDGTISLSYAISRAEARGVLRE